ncbi:unnamed protein product [Lepeophtheirus salmonis]|uniref:(salmon louse) hypothetical protein n=1 Tax=Lepeophtheirus salmonis TaxID=72036 RepID=A0A7R8CLH4_LEPSM|nr:unnamed protein product [Lepeophtheirus salmonis]CAF2852764.1 unnamed protein product [Lepeophtheirus salmonis]
MISEDDSDEDYSTVFNKKSKKEYQNGGNFKGKKSKAVEDILADSIDGSLEGIDATSISSRGEIRRSTRKRTPVIRDEFSLNESFVDEVRNNNYEVNSSEKLSNDIIPDIAFNGTPEICESAQESQDNAHSEDEIEIVGVKIKKKFTPKRVFNYIPPKQYEYNTYKS